MKVDTNIVALFFTIAMVMLVLITSYLSFMWSCDIIVDTIVGFVVFSGNMLRGCAAGVKEFVPADEQGGGWTAVAGARLDYWLVGWC